MYEGGTIWKRLRQLASGTHPHRRWIACAVLALLALSLMMPLALPWDGRLMEAVESAAHFPIFLVAAWSVLLLLQPRVNWPTLRYLAAGVVLAVCLVEVLQYFTHRDPDWRDAVYGCLGGWTGLLLWFSLHSARRLLILGAWLLALLFALPTVVPAMLILADRAHARLSFPLLTSFEGRSEVGRWWSHDCRLSRVNAQVTHGQTSLRVALHKPRATYPGLFMTDGVRDWSGYRQLCFDLYLTGGSERAIWLRADDRVGNPTYEDRAQTLITLVPGANSICLDLDAFLVTPSGRPLLRQHIVQWGLFFDAAQGGESFFLDHIRLMR